MSDTLAHHSFDYTNLDTATAQFVQQQTGEIHQLWGQSLQNMVQIGQRLIQVKARLGHGYFENWLETEFDWSLWLARKFMQVSERFKTVNCTDLSISTSAAYILAAPSTPLEVFDQAIARAGAGKNVGYTYAKNLREEYFSPSSQPVTAPQLEDKSQSPVEQPQSDSKAPPKPYTKFQEQASSPCQA